MSLSKDELSHYSRHLLLEEVGKAGQEKLKNSRVLLIGGGGLGCPAALYLAAVGVGKLGIIDFDTVDVSNLQRQIAFSYDDVGLPKAAQLQKRLASINPHIDIEIYNERFGIDNAEELFQKYDVVVDGCDNFGTRYLSNDTSFFTKTPLVFGAIHRFQGQLSVFNNHAEAPCYRCLFPDPPDAGSIPNCAEAGVLGVLPGVVGTIQATEAVKLILGLGESLSGRFMTYDALSMKFNEFKLNKNPHCPLCSAEASIEKLQETMILCASQKDLSINEIDPEELQKEISNNDKLYLLDVREEYETEISQLPNANLIPLRMLSDVAAHLPKDKDIVVFCHHGIRSREAIKILKDSGLHSLRNLNGGISQWAREVDSDMAQY